MCETDKKKKMGREGVHKLSKWECLKTFFRKTSSAPSPKLHPTNLNFGNSYFWLIIEDYTRPIRFISTCAAVSFIIFRTDFEFCDAHMLPANILSYNPLKQKDQQKKGAKLRIKSWKKLNYDSSSLLINKIPVFH